jgi:D-alanine transaminase
VPRIVWLDGAFMPETEARVSVFDRGFLFADAVYEVTPVLDGRLVDEAGHRARLARSLAALRMESPVPLDGLPALMRELVSRNSLTEGVVYLQISRGAADRDFLFPKHATPTMAMFTQAKALRDTPAGREGLRVVTRPDWRWKRRDIKTTQLLAAVLMKQAARDEGFDDCWLVEDGFVTEGSSSNAWILSRDGRLVTRAVSPEILAGVTRAGVLALARESGLAVEQRPFTVAEAQNAAEAFVTAASSFVTSVVEIDGVSIGAGAPGPVAGRLRALCFEAALA